MRGAWRWKRAGTGVALALLLGVAARCAAQENPLENVHTIAPPPAPPKDTQPAAVTPEPGHVAGTAIHVNVDLVLVPVTVTDRMNRLVTGL